MPILIALFARAGLSQGVSRVLGFVVPVVLAVALIGGGWALWLHGHDKGVVTNDRNAANVKAVSTARKADESAQQAAQGKTDEVQHGNDTARKAADDSDDPLAAGLHSLRHDTAR